MSKNTNISDLQKPHILLATWFGAGLLNPAPGTWGSLAALPFAWLAMYYTGLKGLLIMIVLFFFIAFQAITRFEKETHTKDDKRIVIDEVVGQWIALLPWAFFDMHFIMAAIAFLVFRILDISKLWPVCWFEQNIKGAAGVIADDFAAGIITALLITGLYYAGPG